MEIEYVILGLSVLILLSVLASKITGKFGIPSLLFFLMIGMLAGPEGFGKIQMNDPGIAQGVGILSLIYILFSGGLETDWKEIKPVLPQGIILSTFGVLITAFILGLFCTYLLDISFWEGLLMGGIMGSTDAAAVFMVLRTKKISIKNSLRSLLELESGSNDPFSVFLTVSLVSFLSNDETSSWSFILLFLWQMAIGAPIGIYGGKAMRYVINAVKLEYEALYPALTLALVILLYGITDIIGGNGFLAVYLAGIFLKRENFLHKKSLTLFHDGVAWLMQIIMFLILGILVVPSNLINVAVPGILISLCLVFVARPAAVFLGLIKSNFNYRERALISWVGLKGAVPIILATFPLMERLPNADVIFDLVFFIVLSSTLLQGTSIGFVAKMLRITTPYNKKYRFPVEHYPTHKDVFSELYEIDIPIGAPAVGKSVVNLNFPKGALILLMRRKGDIFVPRGSTQLEENDTMLILASEKNLEEIFKSVIEPDPLIEISIEEAGILPTEEKKTA